ncbi:hypothetical protein SAMN04488691_10646 [Haloferax larsenii]|uniref:Uncharacterized protein n=2 Tax=Haloferax larsenii TaxID=302484 RepID=A0A1H7RIG8_HALLR|nr:hypothetical protein KU306_14150 [Haloferax larsenii]SEL59899.1 hypothetical protein SAMN04488691_10646 [Haloferax larsenii]
MHCWETLMRRKAILRDGVLAPSLLVAVGFALNGLGVLPVELFLLVALGVGVLCTALVFGAESHVQTAAYSAELGGKSDPSVYDEEPVRWVRFGLAMGGLSCLSIVFLAVLAQL